MQMQREEDDEYRRRGRGSPSASSQPVTDLQSPVTVPQFAAFRGSYQLATSSSSSIPEFQSTPSQSFYRYGTAFEEYSAVEDEMDPLAYNSNQFAGGSGWEELGASRKKKKAKSRLSKEQVKCLETCFFEETKLEPGRKNDLAKFLGLQPRQVAVWFQNRRARCRSKQLEQDYEHLKKQYESLLQDKHKLQSEISMLKELAWKKVANGEEQEELLGMLEPLEATNGEKPTRVNSQRHDDRSMTCSDYAVTTEEEEEEEDEEEEEIKMSAIEAELSSSKTIDDDVGSQLSRRRANMTEDLSLPCATNGVEEPHYHNSVNTNYMTMETMQHNNNNNNNNNEYYSQFQYSNWERLHMQFQMAAKFGEGYLQDDLGCMFNPHVRPDDAHTLMACFQETHN